MRLLAFSDLHIHRWPAYASVEEDGRHSRLHDTLRALEEMLSAAKSEKADAVICGGDLFHHPKVDAEILEEVCDRISRSEVPFLYVAGNHDQLSRSHRSYSISNPLQTLKVAQKIGKDGIVVGKGVVLGADYSDDPETQLKARKNRPDVFVCHQGVRGAEISEDFHSAFEHDLSTAKLGKLSKKLVIAGHYHRPQLYEGDTAVLIPGAPIQHTWGDAGQDRGFWIVDVGKRVKCDFYKLSGYPRFVEIDLSKNGLLGKIEPNDFLRVIGSEAAMVERKKPLQKLRERARFVELVVLAEDARETENRLAEAKSGDSPIELARKYVDQFCTVEERRPRLARLGEELLREADAP